MAKMEEHPPMGNWEDEVDLWKYFAILRKVWWKIVLISLTTGVVTLLFIFTKPNIYQATAIITPSMDEKRQNPAMGALASFGVTIGGPSNVEGLESLFKSNDLAVRVFRKYNLWPILFADRFDPVTGKMKSAWTNRLLSRDKGPGSPSDWDAIRAANGLLKVSVNKRAGTVSVSFESPSAEGSANIVKYFLEEGKSRLQEEALDRAIQNKKFIEGQIGKTVDALNRDRLYSLLSQEVEREMMARNREQFGFSVIDSPRVPDRKIKPNRSQSAIFVMVLSFFAGWAYFVVREKSGDAGPGEPRGTVGEEKR